MMCLNNIKTNNILVVGDIMIDQYYLGEITRISDEDSVPIFEKKNFFIRLGGGANTASNLVSARQTVSIASIIGVCSKSDILLNLMRTKGILTDLIIQNSSRITTVKTRFLRQNNQQIFRIDSENKQFLKKDLESEFLNKLLPEISKYSLIILSDYMKGILTYHITKSIIKEASKYNIKVLVDSKDTNSKKYAGAFLIKPNVKELHALTNLPIDSQENIVIASKHLREICNSEYILTTQGGDGMTLVDNKNNFFHIDCISKEVVDTTGAGDTVIAYLAIGIINNFSLIDSMILANYAAGVKVSKRGTLAVSIEEVDKYINNPKIDCNISKIVTLDQLIKTIHIQKHKKIVFTNGCFDILHMGHVHYLKEASKLGDILIVGINSDSSIKKLKSDCRPIIHENDRMSILAALEFVDFVVKFDEETPLYLIEAIKPNVLVKGGDYLYHEIVGKEIVEANGGKIVLIPFIDNKSTTEIINKILNTYTKKQSFIID